MNTTSKDSVKTLTTIVLFMLIAIIAIFVLPKIVSCLMPFFIAWVVSLIIKPIVNLLVGLKFNRRLAVIISMLLAISLIFGVLYGASTIVVKEIKDIAELFSHTRGRIPLFIWDILNILPRSIRSGAIDVLNSLIGDSGEIITSAMRSFLPQISGFAGKLPSGLIFTVVFVMAVYFISYDPDGFKAEAKRLIPADKYKYMHTVKQSFSKACGGYIRAQLIIMSIVFCILLVGFLILDVRFALLLALGISAIDAIPILGTGVILNPWGIICILQGNFLQGIGLVCLYFIILVTRQFIEPRILSGQLGIHPIITLLSMYAGLKLVGIFGMIMGPLVAIVTVSLLRINKELNMEVQKNDSQ